MLPDGHLLNVLNIIALFAPVSISIVLLLLIIFLGICCYDKSRFARFQPQDQGQGNRNITGDKHQVSLPHHDRSHFEQNKSFKEVGGESGAAFFFPMFNAWPIVIGSTFLLLPTLLVVFLATPIADLDSDLMFFQVEEAPVLSLKDLDSFGYLNVLQLLLNLLIWLTLYFLCCSFLADMLPQISARLSNGWHRILPLQYGEKLKGDFHGAATLFLGAAFVSSLSLVSLHLAENEELSVENLVEYEGLRDLQGLGGMTALLTLLLWQSTFYKGAYVFLSLLCADFLAGWKLLSDLIHLLIFAAILYEIERMNNLAGVILGLSVFTLLLVPRLMGFLFSLLEIHRVRMSHRDECEVYLEDLEFLVGLSSFEFELKGSHDLAGVGQLVHISLPSRPFSSSRAIVQKLSKSGSTTVLTLAVLNLWTRPAYFRRHSYCSKCLCASEWVFCSCCMCFLYSCLYSSTQLITYIPEKLTGDSCKEDWLLRFSSPLGSPLESLYLDREVSDPNIFKKRTYCFYTDDYGFRSTLAHYLHCRKERLAAQFTFYCGSFTSFFCILYFLYHQDCRLLNTGDIQLNFVLHINSADASKQYGRRLIATAVRNLGAYKSDYRRLETYLVGRSLLVTTKYGFLPNVMKTKANKQGAGSSHAFVLIGCSELIIQLKKYLVKTKVRNKSFFESIFESSLGALPYAFYEYRIVDKWEDEYEREPYRGTPDPAELESLNEKRYNF